MNDVCTLVVGAKRLGKSYSRVRWVAQVLLPNYPKRHLITNFELDIPAISAYVEAWTKGKQTAEEVAARIHILPRSITNEWKVGGTRGSGPWDLPVKHGIVTKGAHIDLDEIHNFCSVEHDKETKFAWVTWMGELGHNKTTCTYVTQDEGKLAPMIKREVSVTWYLYAKERMRDTWGIMFGDIWQLRAKYSGAYVPVVQEKEHTDFSKQNRQKPRVIEWARTPDIYPLYNSYSKPINDTSEELRIAALVPNRMAEEAKQAGAIEAGAEALADRIAEGWAQFDLLLCHPSVVDLLPPLADQLGDKMPTVNAGTIDSNIIEAIKAHKDDSPPPMEWETKSWPGLLWWFFRRNGYCIMRKLWVPILFFTFVACGGVPWVTQNAPRWLAPRSSAVRRVRHSLLTRRKPAWLPSLKPKVKPWRRPRRKPRLRRPAPKNSKPL